MGKRSHRTGAKSVFIRLAAVFLAIPMFAQAPARKVPVDSLIFDLKSPDPVRRKEAAKLLGENKVKKAVPDLVAAAQDPDTEVRRAIVVALDRMLDMGAQPGFVRLSSDPDKDIRDRCIVGLINLYIPQDSGLVVTMNKVANYFNPWSDEWAEVVVEPGIRVEASTITALGDRLQDADSGIRLKAARALGILKGSAAVPALLDLLRRDESNAIRFEALRAVRKIGEPAAARDLMNYLTYNDNKVRNEAVFTVGRLRYREAVPEMIRLLEKEQALPPKLIDQTYCGFLLDALAFIADPAAKEIFVKEKMNPDDTMRLHATEGLARLADPAMATDISSDWLNEKNPRLKAAQAYALYRMGRKEYLGEVVKYLGDGKSNAEARMLLLELTPAELPGLYSQTKNKDADVREGLAEILGLIGDERALPVLQDLSSDRRGQIGVLANQAIRRINGRMGRPQ